jgi:hypothetical protein
MGWDAPPLNGIRCAKVEAQGNPNGAGASSVTITTVGIDFAGNVFQVHGLDERGKVAAIAPRMPRQPRLFRQQTNTRPHA